MPSVLLSRKSSAAVFGLRGAAGAGASGFFSGFLAALFLEKLFGEFFDEFFAGFFAALFEEALLLGALAFFAAVARLPVDADFARGYLSFR